METMPLLTPSEAWMLLETQGLSALLAALERGAESSVYVLLETLLDPSPTVH